MTKYNSNTHWLNIVKMCNNLSEKCVNLSFCKKREGGGSVSILWDEVWSKSPRGVEASH